MVKYIKQEDDLTHYMKTCQKLSVENRLLKEQLAKFVPVQLEVLEDEEIDKAETRAFELSPKTDTVEKLRLKVAKCISQATINHNMAKGQLYRRVE